MNREKISMTQVVIYLLGYVMKLAPFFTVGIFSMGLFQSLGKVLITVQTEYMFEAAEKLYFGSYPILTVVKEVGLLLICITGVQIINGTQNFLYDVYQTAMKQKFEREINHKASVLKPEFFEASMNLVRLEKASGGVEGSIEIIFVAGDIVAFYLPYFLFMGIYLYRVNRMFLLFLILIFVPVFISQWVRLTLYSKLEDRCAPLRRKVRYYDECISGRRYAKETRNLNAGHFFLRKYMRAIEQYNCEEKKTGFKTNLAEGVLSLLTLLGHLCILWMLFWALLQKKISVGEFAAIYASIHTMFQMMKEVVSYHMGNAAENLGKVKNMIEFIRTPLEVGDETAYDYAGDIVLDGVSFQYPGQKELAVDQVSLAIHSGETIAIVGENGSGKSTLVKIILGMYNPASGVVKIGGKERKNGAADHRGKTAVFQNYVRYKMTLTDNIKISDYKSQKSVETAASHAGVSMDEKRILAPEFGGKDMSGGQWQRIAIARAFYKEGDLIVMDEPTAAIDPLEEDFLYRRFEQLAKTKTALIVTHRLGAVHFADRIIVMSRGRIVESGSHEKLMQNGGLYKDMYMAQMSQYM